MTEYEIAYLASEYINRTWSVMQFWASVSFGLIALSHLGQRHLNLFAALVVSFLYLGFTLFVMNMLRVNGVVVSGFLLQLEELADTPAIGPGARAIVDTAPGSVEMTAIFATFGGLFVGAQTFLWMSYYHSHKSTLKATSEI